MHTYNIPNVADCDLSNACPKRDQIQTLIGGIDDQELDKVINELTLLQ